MTLRALSFGLVLPLAALAAGDRVAVRVDTSQADAVLAILAKRAAGAPVEDADWTRLFATTPYQRLVKREASLKRGFGADEFKAFVLSPALAAREDALRLTLAAWTQTDLEASATRMLAYLPPVAQIRASVYPVIKPRENSFVFETTTNPAIFLSVDPAMSAAAFQNMVAHELHHIGLASLGDAYEAKLAGLPERARTAAGWLGSFGEGMAMLAAAGGPDVHPHHASGPEGRARWDRDVSAFDANLREVEAFLQDVVAGRLADDAAIRERAFTFFGDTQGAWYTVGYRMAAAVERHRGREALLDCMTDPRRLLVRWNELVAERRERGATWSPALLDALR